MTIGEKLKKVRGGMPQGELAKELNIHKNTVGLYERGVRVPDAEYLRKFLYTFPGINPSWLICDEGPETREELARMYRTPEEANLYLQDLWESQQPMVAEIPAEKYLQKELEGRKRRTDDQYCYVPLYDVRASAGGGALVDRENLIDFLAFKSEWIRTQLHAAPTDLYLIYVEGESMEPTLRPGDVILVDHREASELPRDGIYVVRMDGTLLVKRLQRLPGGVINVTSDNTAYQPFTVNLVQEQDGISIIGRVVWCGRRM